MTNSKVGRKPLKPQTTIIRVKLAEISALFILLHIDIYIYVINIQRNFVCVSGMCFGFAATRESVPL